MSLDDLGIRALAKKDKIANEDVDDSALAQSKIENLEDKFTSIEDKLKNVKGIIRFGQSTVSSAFTGSTILERSDLMDEEDEPQVGNLAVFPDSKKLVLYIATITAINGGDSFTVDNLEYLKDNWVMSGEWISGVRASYPEVYTYQGSTYLCIVSDANEAPSKANDKEWKIIAEKPETPSYNDIKDTPKIPHPTYYKLDGDAMEDMGSTDYLISVSNLTPQEPIPVIGDIVVFYTKSATYIGTVKQVQNSNALMVTAKLRTGNGVTE